MKKRYLGFVVILAVFLFFNGLLKANIVNEKIIESERITSEVKGSASIAELILNVIDYYFAIDDELNSKAQQWLDEYETLPDLQSNVYIHLMSLTKEGVKNKDEVIANYLRVLKNFKDSPVENYQLSFIPFINIPDVENSELLTLNCLLNESGCIEKLIKEKETIKIILDEYEPLLNDFKLLTNKNYFNYKDLVAIDAPKFEQLNFIYRLAILEVFYQIHDGLIDQAAENINVLLQIDRILLETSGKVFLTVFPLINWDRDYPQLFLLLLQNDFKHWNKFSETIKPLSNQEISMNNFWRLNFVEGKPMITFQSLFAAKKENTKRLYKNISFYKENMTINRSFELTKYNILPRDILKKDIVNFINYRNDLLNDDLNLSRTSPLGGFSLFFKSPRNFISEIMMATAAPRFINLSRDKISMDLRLQLTRLLIKYNFKASKVNLNDSEFINPYTGEKPFIHDGSICYKEPSEEAEELNICLSFELPNALNN